MTAVQVQLQDYQDAEGYSLLVDGRKFVFQTGLFMKTSSGLMWPLHMTLLRDNSERRLDGDRTGTEMPAAASGPSVTSLAALPRDV